MLKALWRELVVGSTGNEFSKRTENCSISSLLQRKYISAFYILNSDGSCTHRNDDGGCWSLELNYEKVSNNSGNAARYFKNGLRFQG